MLSNNTLYDNIVIIYNKGKLANQTQLLKQLAKVSYLAGKHLDCTIDSSVLLESPVVNYIISELLPSTASDENRFLQDFIKWIGSEASYIELGTKEV